jgi:hypothetical protein
MSAPTAREFLRRMEFTAICDPVTWTNKDANALVAIARRALDALEKIERLKPVSTAVKLAEFAIDDINALAAGRETP